MDRYEKMTDEQLIQKLRDGDNRIVDYIMEKYLEKPLNPDRFSYLKSICIKQNTEKAAYESTLLFSCPESR